MHIFEERLKLRQIKLFLEQIFLGECDNNGFARKVLVIRPLLKEVE